MSLLYLKNVWCYIASNLLALSFDLQIICDARGMFYSRIKKDIIALEKRYFGGCLRGNLRAYVAPCLTANGFPKPPGYVLTSKVVSLRFRPVLNMDSLNLG